MRFGIPTIFVALTLCPTLVAGAPSTARACSSVSGHPIGIFPQPGSVVSAGTSVGVVLGGYVWELESSMQVSLVGPGDTPIELGSVGSTGHGSFGAMALYQPAAPLAPGEYTIAIEYPAPTFGPTPNALASSTFSVDGALETPTTLAPPALVEWAFEFRAAVQETSCGSFLEGHAITLSHPDAGAGRTIWYEVTVTGANGDEVTERAYPPAVSPDLFGTRGEPGDPTLARVSTQFGAHCISVTAHDQFGNASAAVTTCQADKCRAGDPEELWWSSDFSDVEGCELNEPTGCAGGGTDVTPWWLLAVLFVAWVRRRHRTDVERLEGDRTWLPARR